MASSIGAQTNSVSIYVDEGRPVDAAIQSLVDRYPVVITYEDPPYEYSRDIVLNLDLVAERPTVSTPTFQLPPPRPGDPTPAGPPFRPRPD